MAVVGHCKEPAPIHSGLRARLAAAGIFSGEVGGTSAFATEKDAKMRVLVVEDERNLAESVRRGLPLKASPSRSRPMAKSGHVLPPNTPTP